MRIATGTEPRRAGHEGRERRRDTVVERLDLEAGDVGMTKIPLSDDELDGVSGGAYRPDPRYEAWKQQQQYQAEMAAQARQAAEAQKAYNTAQAEGAKRYQAEQAQHQPQMDSARGANGTGSSGSTSSPSGQAYDPLLEAIKGKQVAPEGLRSAGSQSSPGNVALTAEQKFEDQKKSAMEAALSSKMSDNALNLIGKMVVNANSEKNAALEDRNSRLIADRNAAMDQIQHAGGKSATSNAEELTKQNMGASIIAMTTNASGIKSLAGSHGINAASEQDTFAAKTKSLETMPKTAP